MFQVRLHTGLRFKLGNTIYLISKMLPEEKVEAIDESFNHSEIFTWKELIKQLDSGNLFFEVPNYNTQTSTATSQFEYNTNYLECEEHKDIAIFRLNVIKPLIAHKDYLIGSEIINQRVIKVNSYKDNLEKAREVFNSNYFKEVSKASIYRWIKRYEASSHDIRSLLPSYFRCGAKNKPRVNELVMDFINDEIQNFYQNKRRVSVYDLYIKIVHRVSEYNQFSDFKIKLPSYMTISRYVNKIPEYDLISNRYNKRTADNQFSEVDNGVEVRYPLERVEIDGTPIDLIVTDENGEVIGRPVLIIAIDKLTRYIVGFSISFGGEGWQDVMLCIRHIIMDKSYVRESYPDIKNEWKAYGIPQIIVVDNSLGFKNNAMDDAAYELGATLLFCPVKTPQWKGSIERFFRTSCTSLIHKLPGTTRSNSSQLSTSENPTKEACISLSLLTKLFHKWIIDEYSQRLNKGAGGIPSKIWDKAVQDHPVAWPNSNQEIPILLGKVEMRQIRNTGIELMNLHYNSIELNKLYHQFSQSNNGKNVNFKIKYDPFNINQIFVYDHLKNKTWIEAKSVYPQYTENLSEYEHKLACARILKELGEIDIVALAKTRYEILEEVNGNVKSALTQKQKARIKNYNSMNILNDSNSKTKSEKSSYLDNIACSNDNISDIGTSYQPANNSINGTEKDHSANKKSKIIKDKTNNQNSSEDLLLPEDFEGFDIIDDL